MRSLNYLSNQIRNLHDSKYHKSIFNNKIITEEGFTVSSNEMTYLFMYFVIIIPKLSYQMYSLRYKKQPYNINLAEFSNGR